MMYFLIDGQNRFVLASLDCKNDSDARTWANDYSKKNITKISLVSLLSIFTPVQPLAAVTVSEEIKSASQPNAEVPLG